MKDKHMFNTCRWCRHYRNGECTLHPMEAEISISGFVEHAIDDGEISDLLSEHMPHHINNLIEKLVPELPAKWKKTISTALLDSSNSDYWDMAECIEIWLRKFGDSIINNGQVVVVNDPNDFACKYFE